MSSSSSRSDSNPSHEKPAVAKSIIGSSSRRSFLQTSTAVAAAATVTGMFIPKVHAAEDNTIRVALIGCGGRGTGAADNALTTYNKEKNPIKLVAMADVWQNKLDSSVIELTKKHPAQFDVPKDRQFIGFDGYQKAIECLRPGDIAIFTTPPAFRWVHFGHAIEKGLNVFMEKPLTVDGPGSVKMLKLAEESIKKNLKVGVGLMCRHCDARQELFKRIQDGQIGDINLLRAYRVAGPTASEASPPRNPAQFPSELLWQISRFHSFIWASGGCYSDFLIHNIDECCWMKNAWPVNARALGGRHYRGINVDQNFDNYSVEYTFADGAKLMLEGRCMPGCWDQFSSYAHGTKGSAIISKSSHWPANSRIFKGQDQLTEEAPVWQFGKEKNNPYQKEWFDLIEAVRSDKPYNEVERGVKASVVTSMGRRAAHTGQLVTFEQMLNNATEFAPGLDKLTMDSPAPVQAGADGKYPIPQPGIVVDREY